VPKANIYHLWHALHINLKDTFEVWAGISFKMNETMTRKFLSACRMGKADAVRNMIADPNFDVNVRLPGGQWALREAVENVKIDIVEMLLAHPRIDVNQIDLAWDSALHRAVVIYGGKGKQILEMLLAHPDIDVNIMTRRIFEPDGGMTPLMYAREHAHVPNRAHAIEHLLAHS
jgi:ankyrin repeat protein